MCFAQLPIKRCLFVCSFVCVIAICPYGQVRCGGESPRNPCIYSGWLCDGDNDCGNGWDEEEEECGELFYLSVVKDSRQYLRYAEVFFGGSYS